MYSLTQRKIIRCWGWLSPWCARVKPRNSDAQSIEFREKGILISIPSYHVDTILINSLFIIVFNEFGRVISLTIENFINSNEFMKFN